MESRARICAQIVSASICQTVALPLAAMSDLDEPPAVRRLDLAKMNRLAFIRLLYLQGIEQYRKMRPLSAASILTFHDTAELFLILAADHLQAGPVTRDSGLLQYWTVLRSRRGFAGVELSGQHGIARLISVRNDFKHLGALPSADDVDDARSSVTGFLEDNTPKVFGLEFSGIDMADVVPQERARASLKAASAAESAGNRTEAMAQLAEAFDELFRPYAGQPFGFAEAYGFGSDVQGAHGLRSGMGAALNTISSQIRSNQARGLEAIGRNVDDNIHQLNEVVAAIQRGMRVMAVGLEYARYNRFDQLTPKVFGSGEHRRVQADFDYAPSRDEYDYCVQFVIAAALRLAELEADTAKPSWIRVRLGETT
jgi:hypothetical protein